MSTEEKEKLHIEENGDGTATGGVEDNGQELEPVVVTRAPDTESKGSVGLKKNVTLMNGIGLIVGSIIGSGIFISPKGVLEKTGSVGMSLIIWLLCGIIAMCGALCYGELGTTIRKSGAEYAYFKDAFGPVPAFLFGWTGVLVIRPSAVAGISVVFAEYVAKPFYGDSDAPTYLLKLIALACIIIITIINCASVKAAVRTQDIFMYAKLLCIAILVVIGFIALGKGTTNFDNSFAGTTTNIGKIGYSCYLGLWAYDGWNTLNYVTEEMRNPKRDLPLAIIISMTLVTTCYLLINVAYVAVIGASGIVESNAVALGVGKAYLGPAHWIIPILVASSAFGAVNGCAFGNGRLAFASARDGLLPSILAMVQTKRSTPMPSLIFTSFIACLMLIPDASSFEKLIGLFSFASWLFYGGCFAVLLFLRWKRPKIERPYKVFIGIPIAMLIMSLFLCITPIIDDFTGSLIALAIILCGLPFYYIFIVSNLVPDWFKRGVDSFNLTSQKLCGVALTTESSNSEEHVPV